MLGNQSSAMERNRLAQRKNELKVKIWNMALEHPEKLSELNDPFLGSFNENDQADVLSGIIWVTEPNICSSIITTLVKNHEFGVNGLIVNKYTPLSYASYNYLKGKNKIGKVDCPTVVETLLELGANPHNKDNEPQKSIYELLHQPCFENGVVSYDSSNKNGLVVNFFEKKVPKMAKELIGLFDKYFPNKH